MLSPSAGGYLVAGSLRIERVDIYQHVHVDEPLGWRTTNIQGKKKLFICHRQFCLKVSICSC